MSASFCHYWNEILKFRYSFQPMAAVRIMVNLKNVCEKVKNCLEMTQICLRGGAQGPIVS